MYATPEAHYLGADKDVGEVKREGAKTQIGPNYRCEKTYLGLLPEPVSSKERWSVYPKLRYEPKRGAPR